MRQRVLLQFAGRGRRVEPVFLFLHLIATYVHLGTNPLWEFVGATARNLLAPLRSLPLRLARFDWVLITDADGTYPVEAIPRLLAEAATNSMVVGARIGDSVRVPWERRPAKWFLNRLASYLAVRHLPDINSGLRLMRKSLVARYEHLLPQGFSFTTTITLAAACNGHPFTYVPIDYFQRLGRPKIKPRHGSEFGKGGVGFLRLNFACPREMLNEALEKMSGAMKKFA